MNKTELIEEIAGKTGFKKSDAHKFVDAFTSVISDSLRSNNDVNLVGFGSFSVSIRPARTGRNPKTGESIRISEAKMPKFKAGKFLKDSINS